MHWVKEFDYEGNYKFKIKFENNKLKTVDLKNHLKGKIFEPLKDVSYIKKARLNKDIDTIAWPNDADFSPDFLYEIGK